MATTTEQLMFVGGDWRASAPGETFDATSPATGEVIGTVPQGDRDDARQAIDAARAAADAWARLTAFERAAKMTALAAGGRARRAASSRARCPAIRASRCAPRPTTRSTSSLSTGTWPRRMQSALAA